MWLEFPGLSANSVSGIMSPDGQGASSSGSNKTSSFLEMPIVSFARKNCATFSRNDLASLFVLTLHKSV